MTDNLLKVLDVQRLLKVRYFKEFTREALGGSQYHLQAMMRRKTLAREEQILESVAHLIK